ncbi:MAG: hypothetical protein RSB04_10295 [Gordonibacter sp.]|uniref:hypothetical protein n=1 Tax=Gordonibacter sp. TaxID=1968902 RepID=UPI002FC872C2
MQKITGYLIHDAVMQIEEYVVDFDLDHLKIAEDSGLIIIAEYDDGHRERVRAKDVVEPEPENRAPLIVVQPVYVDDRMKAVVGVFDALETELFSPVMPARTAAISEDPETGEVAGAERPFAAALAALKSIVYEAAAR